MAGAIPRSIPSRAPRLAATVPIELREGGPGSTPYPLDPVVAGDVVLVCSGVDRESEAAPVVSLRATLAAFDIATGERRYLLELPHGRKGEAPAPDQAGLPGVSPDGLVAQLIRRGDEIRLLIADPGGDGSVVEVAPAVPRLPRAAEAVLSRPLPGPGGAWIASWGLRSPDPRRLGQHRTECLREDGPPLWWADDERVLGSSGDIVLTRVVTETIVGRLVGRRAGTGAQAWETDVSPGTRVEMFDDLVLLLDRSRRARERLQRHDSFARARNERIANDPIGSREIDWAEESVSAFRAGGRLAPGPVRGIDAQTGAVRFRAELDGDLVGALAGGPHVVCLVVVDEEGVGGIVRRRASDGAELGRRGFHVDDHFHEVAASPSEKFPELLALDHTHLLWLDGQETLVCEVLADPGREAWRLALPPLAGAVAFAVSAGRVFIRDSGSLRIFHAADDG